MPPKNSELLKQWKELMPDFRFYFWNDKNITNFTNRFTEQCISKKAYAFAADYIRLKVVNHFGGFYLDTDMKLIKPLVIDEKIKFQICEEVEGRANWGYFYSTPNNSILLDCLKKYENLYFDQFKPPVIPYFLNEIILDNKENISILTPEHFYPLPMDENPETWQNYITTNTVGIHLWDFSWGKLKKNRIIYGEIIYRLFVLFMDFFTFQYPPYYYRINMIRLYRLLKKASE